MALSPNHSFPTAQVITPVNAQLGYTSIFTPDVSSGIPTTAIDITPALVAELIQASPIQQYNFTYIFGMANAFFPMPTVGRNVYNLSMSIMNGLGYLAGVYTTVNLLSNANALILGRLELESGDLVNPNKLTLVNTTIYERPPFLGIVAGATEAQQIVAPISFFGSIDFANTTLGDGLLGITNTLDKILGIVDGL